jgi:ribose 5-phosphate isomerase A
VRQDSALRAKQAAGIRACDFVTDGMLVGLGTGSTVKHTIIELGRRIREESLHIKGIPTSKQTEELALELQLPLLGWADFEQLDVTIDGADEFDSSFQLIKGGGGALTREKMVASVSKAMVVVADPSKDVATLGLFPLPVEILQFGWEMTLRQLQTITPGKVRLRGAEQPFITDNGNLILDCHFGPTISDPLKLETMIRSNPGVVECGLFNDMCDVVVIGSEEKTEVRFRPDGRLQSD